MPSADKITSTSASQSKIPVLLTSLVAAANLEAAQPNQLEMAMFSPEFRRASASLGISSVNDAQRFYSNSLRAVSVTYSNLPSELKHDALSQVNFSNGLFLLSNAIQRGPNDSDSSMLVAHTVVGLQLQQLNHTMHVVQEIAQRVDRDRPIVAQQSGLYLTGVQTAFEKLERSRIKGNPAELMADYAQYQEAKEISRRAGLGLMVLGYTIPALGAFTVGLMNREMFQSQISKLLHQPIGLNYEKRSYLEDLMDSSRSRLGTIVNAFKVLSYLIEENNDHKARACYNWFRVLAFSGACAAGLSCSAAGFLSGSVLGSVVGHSVGGALVAGTAVLMFASDFMENQGRKMVSEFEAWKKLRE